jgi:hypothetical protein
MESEMTMREQLGLAGLATGLAGIKLYRNTVLAAILPVASALLYCAAACSAHPITSVDFKEIDAIEVDPDLSGLVLGFYSNFNLKEEKVKIYKRSEFRVVRVEHARCQDECPTIISFPRLTGVGYSSIVLNCTNRLAFTLVRYPPQSSTSNSDLMIGARCGARRVLVGYNNGVIFVESGDD